MIAFALLALEVTQGQVPKKQANPAPVAQGPASPHIASETQAKEDAQAEAAFAKLDPADQKDLADYFRAESAHLPTFQASLVKFVLGEMDRDPGVWPEETAAPWFDSKEHTPENDIPRHPLAADSAAVKELSGKVFAKAPAPRFAVSWRYDYGARGLVRKKDWKDPARIFRNGLKGALPDFDLVEALVERSLDDGTEQKSLFAFGHAYTDRDGGAFPGITLYDAWGSGLEIETPDVDTLGIVHTVLGDRKTWHAPVPAAQHDQLFDKIGEIYRGAERHRELRHALAVVFLEGTPHLGPAYDGYLDNLHALWEDCRSTPATLLPRLPKSARRDEFLKEWTKRCHEDGRLWGTALRRHATLESEGEPVRALLLRLLQEFVPTLRSGEASPGKPRR